MPDQTTDRLPEDFQPLLLGIQPVSKSKDYGYGAWEVECARCGKIRSLNAYKVKSTGRIIGAENLCPPCSKAKFFQKRVPIKCPVCGIVREMTLTAAKQRLSSYCKRCFLKKGTPRIRNGRHTCKLPRGYIVILGMMGHPLAKKNQVLEHWLTLYEQHPMGPESVVWFKRQGFTIHHKNGVRDDNRLENLELRARGKHPNGWTIDEMEEAIRRYRSKATASHENPPSL